MGCGLKQVLNFFQFAIDVNTESLKSSGCRVDKAVFLSVFHCRDG